MFNSPLEYRAEEIRRGHAAKMTTSAGTRVSQSMSSCLEEYARQHESQASVVIRHALFEFFQARGIDPFGLPGIRGL
jgi:phosphosulfolactate phosphohydrolase-like enzyme